MRFILRTGLLVLGTLNLLRANERFPETPAPTRWAIDAGYAYRLWESSSQATPAQRDYENRAKHGLILGGEVAAFPWEHLGLGVVFNQFHSAVSGHNLEEEEDLNDFSRDSYLIRYAGPVLYFKREAGNFAALAQIGAGCFFYANDHATGDFPGVIQSQVPGIQAGLSLDYRIFRYAGIGITARAMHGLVKWVDYNGIHISLSELQVADISLTRLDVAVGIRLYP